VETDAATATSELPGSLPVEDGGRLGDVPVSPPAGPVGALPVVGVSVEVVLGGLALGGLGGDTVTSGVDTLTAGVDTLTPGSDTPTLGSDTLTPGSGTPTPGRDTTAFGSDTPIDVACRTDTPSRDVAVAVARGGDAAGRPEAAIAWAPETGSATHGPRRSSSATRRRITHAPRRRRCSRADAQLHLARARATSVR